MPHSLRRAWVDLESTGFTDLHKKAVYQHKILELALVVTDQHLEPIARLNLVIHHDLAEVLPLCDDVVIKMHQVNGLFKDVEKSLLSLEEAERKAIAFLSEHGVGPEACPSPICGNGVHFDRTFLAVHMPNLEGHFHYRNLDVSSMKEFINTIEPGLEPTKKKAHRAMDDIEESLAEARHYQGILQPALRAAKADMQSRRKKEADDSFQP